MHRRPVPSCPARGCGTGRAIGLLGNNLLRNYMLWKSRVRARGRRGGQGWWRGRWIVIMGVCGKRRAITRIAALCCSSRVTAVRCIYEARNMWRFSFYP